MRLLGDVLERLDLTKLTKRDQLNLALQERGFRLKPGFDLKTRGDGAPEAKKEGEAVKARLEGGGGGGKHIKDEAEL